MTRLGKCAVSFAILSGAFFSGAPSAAEGDGVKTVTGKYTYYTDSESLDIVGDVVCFNADKSSNSVFPAAAVRQAKKRRIPVGFCFAGGIDPKAALGLKNAKLGCSYSGSATILIKDFGLYTDEGDGHSEAALVSVKSKSPAKISECEQ